MPRIGALFLLLSCLTLPSTSFAKAKTTAKPAPSGKTPASTAHPVYEPDGAFGFCLTDKTYPDGRKLTIALSPSKQVNIGVTIPQGHFTVGARYDLQISLDGGSGRKIRAATLDEETLLLQMGANAAFRKKLERAKQLQLSSPSNTVSFDLPPMDVRIKDLETCIASKAKTRDEQVAQAEKLMPETLKAILITAGFKDIQPLDMSEVPVDERPADFMWQTNGILSGVRERAVPADKTLSDMVGIHMQGLKKHCSGRFNAQLGREKTTAAMTLRTGDVSCTPTDEPNSDKGVAVAMLMYLTKAGAFTVFTFEGPTAQRKELDSTRDKLLDALTSLAKN